MARLLENGSLRALLFFAQIKAFIENSIFEMKLKYYIWRYGGINHIPGDIIGKLFPITEQGYATLDALSLIIELSQVLPMNLTQGNFATILVQTDAKQHNRIDLYQYVGEFLSQPVTRQRVLDSLLEFKDIDEHQYQYYQPQIEAWLKK